MNPFLRFKRLAPTPVAAGPAPLDGSGSPVDRLFEATGHGLILVDAATGRVARLNDKARERFGYGDQAPADLRVERLLPDLPVALAARAKRSLGSALAAPFTLQGQARRGDAFTVEVTLMRISVPGAREPHLLLVVRDRQVRPLGPQAPVEARRPATLAAA